ncbi:MAG: DUF835 domain-containing protein [Thermoplasmata archaeon]
MTSASSSSVIGTAEPRPGNVYMIEERRPRVSYELFEQTLSSGYTGMIITRDYPRKLEEEMNLGSCRVVWLTNFVGEGRINPTAIGILMGQIRNFIEGQQKSAVLLDGLEYLITLNTYDRMLQFMHQVKDVVVTNDSIMFVPLDPRTVSQRELALLERSMEPLVPRSENEPQDESVLEAGEEGVLRLLGTGPR